ncbi:MAG: MATE family efflux transporter [Candidatus Avoscillospira sp.]
MNREKTFFRTVCGLAAPVALQSMLQSSFSIVDQIMIGQLGSVAIAGVGLAGKFSSIHSVVGAAIGAVAGIMISQYMGQKNQQEVRRSFYLNLAFSILLALAFTAFSLFWPREIMGLYTNDLPTIEAAAAYLAILAAAFLPMAGATMLSALFRCMEKASLPLYASAGAALVNTGLNYLLIFGKLGLPALGARGAAVATVISQLINLLVMLGMLARVRAPWKVRGPMLAGFRWRQYAAMLLPVLICEFLWSLGENVYAGIYGHMGAAATAAMTLLNPIQGLMTGALCGLAQAAGVLIGKDLGRGDFDGAYRAAKKLLLYGFAASLCLSAVIVLIRPFYVEIYQVEDAVKASTARLLVAYALVAPFKVQNMILGSGILRSGGNTSYVMWIDLIGTWLFGVPLGLLSAFAFRWSIPLVYFTLSLEECVRFALSLWVLRRKRWMRTMEA